jgi:hypothetical protein
MLKKQSSWPQLYWHEGRYADTGRVRRRLRYDGPGTPKRRAQSHVVLDSALVRPQVDPENEHYGLAVHTLCHQMAHVYDHMLRVKAMPNHYRTVLTDLREAVRTQFAMAAWDEYAASRLSAPWGTDDYSSTYEQSLLKCSSRFSREAKLPNKHSKNTGT